MKNREKWIDNAKGIAIILVILAHVNDRFSFAYGFHLVVFFVLSGYTLKIESITRKYLNKKFNRLMVPYFYTCVAIILTDIANDHFVRHDISIKATTKTTSYDLVRSFFASGSYKNFGNIEIGGRIGAIWFLPAMFFSLLFFQLACKYIQRDSQLGAGTCIMAAFGIITAQFIWLPFSVQSAMFALPFIYAGHQLKKHGTISKLKWHHYLISQIVLIVGIKTGNCYLAFVRATLPDMVLSPIIGLSGCMMVILVARLYTGRLLGYLGKISLTVLCVHLYALETMGWYFGKALDSIGAEGELRTTISSIIHLGFAIIIAVLIEKQKKYHKQMRQDNTSKEYVRDIPVDIAKGILIVSMIVGHFPIDKTLRSIIFSCHMVAFIVFSGYFYNPKKDIMDSLKRVSNGLIIPYLTAAIMFVVISYKSWSLSFFKRTAVKYLLGMSFAKNVLTNADSVGPIYFILLLTIVRLLYFLVDHKFKTETLKWMVVLGVSLIGVACGVKGYWLPWSFDVACYSLIFYRIGVILRVEDHLKTIAENSYFYFLLSPIWAFMIYSGSMEIAVRKYGRYGLTIIGAIAGIILIYMLSKYICENLRIIGNVLSLLGRCSMYILVVHTILGGTVANLISQKFDPTQLPFMVCSLVAQLTVAVIGYSIIQYGKNTLITTG